MILIRGNQRYLLYYGIVVVFSLLQGCFSMTKEVKEKQVSRIEIGKSTRDDVLAILGLPHKRELKIFEGDKKLEFWTYYKGRGGSIIYTSMLGTVQPTSGRPGYLVIYFAHLQTKEREDIAAVLVFDQQGLVLDLKTKGE